MVFVDGKKNMHCFCGFCQERRTCIAFLNTSTPSTHLIVTISSRCSNAPTSRRWIRSATCREGPFELGSPITMSG